MTSFSYLSSGLSDLAGSTGVRDAPRRALHHPRERRHTLGGVRTRAQSCLPQTFYHGSQPGWHGGGPLGVQEISCWHVEVRDFLQQALGAAGFPSIAACCGNKEKPIGWKKKLSGGFESGKENDILVAGGAATVSCWKNASKETALWDCRERGVSYLPFL